MMGKDREGRKGWERTGKDRREQGRKGKDGEGRESWARMEKDREGLAREAEDGEGWTRLGGRGWGRTSKVREEGQ